MKSRHVYCIEFLKQYFHNLKQKKICDFGAGEGGLLEFYLIFINVKMYLQLNIARKLFLH